MSNVLSFNDAPRVVSARSKPGSQMPCEVVIFPGVRFERREQFDTASPEAVSK